MEGNAKEKLDITTEEVSKNNGIEPEAIKETVGKAFNYQAKNDTRVFEDEAKQKRFEEAAEEAAKMAGIDPEALKRVTKEVVAEIFNAHESEVFSKPKSKCKDDKADCASSKWNFHYKWYISDKQFYGTICAVLAGIGIWWGAKKYLNNYETDSSSDEFGF